MSKLGTGLSVENLCVACGITYNELCALADEYQELFHELKKWYKRFDFTVKKLNFDEPVFSVNPETYWKVKQEVKHETVKDGDIEIKSDDINSLKTKEKNIKIVRKPRKKVEGK